MVYASKKDMKSNIKEWNVKLRVSPEEEKKIKKDAIDYEMKLSEYIKFKVLSESPQQETLKQK